jgi:hypothetical protein
MADIIPVKAIYSGTYGSSDVTSLGEYTSTDTIAKTYLDTDLADKTADAAWTGSQRSTLIVDNDGSFDMNGGNNFKCTVSTGTITITFTNITNGQSGFILLVNSGATMAAAGTTKVDANLLATITTAGTYLISYLSDGTNVYLTNSAIYT